MTLQEILDRLDGKLVSNYDVDLQTTFEIACGADLMSDVLAFTHVGTLLLTGLINPQVVRTAEMAEIKGIVFVRGKMPPPATIHLADEHQIPLLVSRYTMYESCGRLYQAGLKSCGLFELSNQSYDQAPDRSKT